MKKYFKAQLMLYNRLEYDENGNRIVIRNHEDDFTNQGEIIVTKGLIGYNEICTGKSFNYYEYSPIYTGVLFNKRIFHITDLDDNLTKEEIIKYVEEFDYDKFEDTILMAGRGKKFNSKDSKAINKKLKRKRK